MTQDVQPLTWQKRTNLEEHQQFFSKINEIIDNLAPTVDEAEAAIAQATAAIASANDAIATANAASAAASAAASQAQTAASTVAGYDTRLTAAEGDIDALQAADQTITGNVAALGTRMTAAESKNTQQDSAIAALQTADTNNVKISGTHAIGDYAVLLVNNQENITGIKGFLSRIYARDPGEAVGQVGGSLTASHTDIVIMSTIKITYNAGVVFTLTGTANNANYFEAKYVFVSSRADSTPALYCIEKKSNSGSNAPFLYFKVDGDTVTFYGLTVQYCAQTMYVDSYRSFGQEFDPAADYRMKLATNAGTVVQLPEGAVAEVTLTNRL